MKSNLTLGWFDLNQVFSSIGWGKMLMKRRKIKLGITGIILIPALLITLPFFCIGAWEFMGVYQNSRTFSSTEGEVIFNTLITSQDLEDPTLESSTYHPVVRFSTANGETITFTGKGGSYPAKYEISETVPVLYNPADPSEAQIKSWEMWFVPILFMVIGFLPGLTIGATVLSIRILVKKHAKKRDTKLNLSK